MKRKIKNLIMIIILIAMAVLIFYITNEIKKDDTSESTNIEQSSIMGNGTDNSTTPPVKPDGKNGSENTDTTQTPPEKPEGESSNENTESPKTSDDTTNNEQNSNGNVDSSTTPPEKPDGEGTPSGSMGGNGQGMPQNETNSSSVDYKKVAIVACAGFVFSVDLLYLLISRFNKKKIKSVDKIIIIILTSIILTGVITFGSYYYAINSKTEKTNTNTENQPNQTTSAEYNAKTEITKDTEITDGEYESSTADENAISVSGNIEATLSNIEVTKSGDSDGGDNTSFYGTNSAIIAKSGATLNLKNIKVTTNATGANGVFSYGGSATTNNSSSDGTTVNISDSTITTTKDNSGGIMTTGGGVTNATNLTITTSGTSSAAIRSDRGGGTVTVNKGTYKTTGQGSPAVYSTANITVKNAKLIATTSEGIVIEGKNSVTIDNVELTDTNNKLNGQSTTYKNIFLYQSVSGDASEGTSEFTAKNSTITTNKGDTFYITNTTAEISLSNNKITNNDSNGYFLRAKSDSWGKDGSNGGDVTLTMTNQTANGDIYIDSISTLDMTMTSSKFKGAINKDKTAKSIKLTISKDSTLTLTADSYVTSLDDKDTTYSNINFNGYKLYVNGTAIN